MSDRERMNKDILNPVINSFPNREFYKLIIAESWDERITNWWIGTEIKNKWDRTWLPKNVGSYYVDNIGGSQISWLYAIEKLDH